MAALKAELGDAKLHILHQESLLRTFSYDVAQLYNMSDERGTGGSGSKSARQTGLEVRGGGEGWLQLKAVVPAMKAPPPPPQDRSWHCYLRHSGSTYRRVQLCTHTFILHTHTHTHATTLLQALHRKYCAGGLGSGVKTSEQVEAELNRHLHMSELRTAITTHRLEVGKGEGAQ